MWPPGNEGFVTQFQARKADICFWTLHLSENSLGVLQFLLDAYVQLLVKHFGDQETPDEERQLVLAWTASKNISSVDSGIKWLFVEVMAETAKRVAGLEGLSSLDREGFYQFILGEAHAQTLFDHPLIQLVSTKLSDPASVSNAESKLLIAQRCYDDFCKYQRPGVETLRYEH